MAGCGCGSFVRSPVLFWWRGDALFKRRRGRKIFFACFSSVPFSEKAF